QLVRTAARRFVKRHHSSLHFLYRAYELDPATIETIVHSRRSPTATLPYATSIAPDRKAVIAEHNRQSEEIRVYSDGSGQDGKIGTAAVLYRGARTPPVGLTLAAKLIATERDATFPLSIYVDNQAAIKSGEVFTTRPGHYIMDKLCRMITKIHKD
ncbi:hypothetical protein HYDPIDRAFT_75178, partial [Hydnomerulius pinastri MD-312]